MADKAAHYQVADLDWQPRWNSPDAACAALSQAGPEVMATGFFGVVRFSLDDTESVAAIVQQCRSFADMLHAAKVRYDTALGQELRDPHDPPSVTYDASSRSALLAARRHLDSLIARASVRR